MCLSWTADNTVIDFLLNSIDQSTKGMHMRNTLLDLSQLTMEKIFQSQIEGSDCSLDENKHKWHLMLMCCILNDSNKGELSWQKSLNLSNFLKKMYLLITFDQNVLE